MPKSRFSKNEVSRNKDASQVRLAAKICKLGIAVEPSVLLKKILVKLSIFRLLKINIKETNKMVVCILIRNAVVPKNRVREGKDVAGSILISFFFFGVYDDRSVGLSDVD